MMRKEKMHIPMPDDERMEMEIKKIVAQGLRRQPSFWVSLQTIVQQIGFRQLFSDRSEQVYLWMMALMVGVIFFVKPDLAVEQVADVYAFLFLVSPVLFFVFSVYTYANKITNGTYEVEMTCKYDVYQMIAFRMLAFSIVTIVMNAAMIAGFVALYENVAFLRALVISTTGLFVFSVFFLFVMWKRRSTMTVVVVIGSWLLGNILAKQVNASLYNDMLVHLPLVVYALVLIGAAYMYVQLLKKFMRQHNAEGVF